MAYNGQFRINLTAADPRWVGAWWIGCVAAAILAFPVFWFLLPYGRELPCTYLPCSNITLALAVSLSRYLPQVIHVQRYCPLGLVSLLSQIAIDKGAFTVSITLPCYNIQCNVRTWTLSKGRPGILLYRTFRFICSTLVVSYLY